MDDNYFSELARKALERMRPEHARRALAQPKLCIAGFYNEPDLSCCCPFGAGLGIDPKTITDEDRDRIDAATFMAITEAGYLDVTDYQKSPYFTKGLARLSEAQVRYALEVAAARES